MRFDTFPIGATVPKGATVKIVNLHMNVTEALGTVITLMFGPNCSSLAAFSPDGGKGEFAYYMQEGPGHRWVEGRRRGPSGRFAGLQTALCRCSCVTGDSQCDCQVTVGVNVLALASINSRDDMKLQVLPVRPSP